MTQLTANEWTTGDAPEYRAPAVVDARRRSILQPLLLIIPIVMAAASYSVGGIPWQTDLSFVCLAILCVYFVITELYRFSERFGIGGLVLYGGVLVWFCQDYFAHWFGATLTNWDMPVGRDVVAKSAMFHMIFIMCMAVGLRFRFGKILVRWSGKFPRPADPRVFFWVVVLTQIIGLLPYVVFTGEPFYMAIYHQIVAGRTGGAAWLYGRSGNANYNWGAYIAQILQVGEGGAILGIFYAFFYARGRFEKTLCYLAWLLWLLLGFGTGTRGEVIFLMIPFAGFLFIKHNAKAAELMRRFSLNAYVFLALLVFATLLIVQVQIRFRNEGFNDVDLSTVTLTNVQGNTMFSEGLKGFSFIPERRDFFYNDVPGEAIIMPIPNFLFYFVIHPIPRVLWPPKPIDPAGPWYNDVAMGGSGMNGGRVEGTTISEGLVGYWYFRFGLAGVIEGGLLVGWMMGLTERMLLNADGNPMTILFALATATWLFRCYRDISFPEFFEAAIGVVGLVFLILMVRPFFAAPAPTMVDAEYS
jgi:hypothetical protein